MSTTTASIIPGYLTIQEAAEALGVSPSQVNRYITAGRLKALDLGKQWLIPASAVAKFQRRPPGNPTFRRVR